MSEQPHPTADPYQRAEAEAQEEQEHEHDADQQADDAVTEDGSGRMDATTDLVTDGSAARADDDVDD